MLSLKFYDNFTIFKNNNFNESNLCRSQIEGVNVIKNFFFVAFLNACFKSDFWSLFKFKSCHGKKFFALAGIKPVCLFV